MAVSTGTQWEARATGNSANNGSGFDPIYGGVDYSQQDAPQHIYTDLVSAVMPAPASAPTVAALAGGGTIPANTYYVVVSYYNTDGNHETVVSAESAVVVAANGRIQVSSPAALGGCEHYRVYVGTASGGPYRRQTTSNNPSGDGMLIGDTIILTAYNAGGTAPPVSGTLFNQVSSAARPFVANDKGNIIYITGSGSGAFLAFVRYQIQNVVGGVATLDKRVASAAGATAGPGRLGGGASGGPGSLGNVRGSNTVWIKNGTSAGTATTGISTGYTGERGRYVRVFGYGSTRGDGVTAVINGTVNNTIYILSVSGTFQHFKGLEIVGTGVTASGFGLNAATGSSLYESITIRNKNNGIRTTTGPNIFYKCLTKDTSDTGLFCEGSGGAYQAIYFYYSRFTAAGASGGNGYGIRNLDGGIMLQNCIIDHCKIGFFHDTPRFISQINQCVIDNHTTAGIQIGNAANSDVNNLPSYDTLYFRNNIISNNTIAVNNVSRFNFGATFQEVRYRCNAFYNNGTKYVNMSAAPDDVDLTADPFVNVGTGDYAINNVNGGGKTVRAIGCPGTFADGVNAITGLVGFGGLQSSGGGTADAPIENFEEVQFPTDISRGTTGGPMFRTTITITGSGSEQRFVHWTDPLYRWNVGLGVRTREQADELTAFFIARMGRATGFRFKDWRDYTIETAEDTSLLTSTTFQIVKRYTSGAVTKVRKIKKPVEGTVKVWNGVTEITTGWTVDTTTGIITFAVAPAYLPAVTCEFDVPVRFDTDTMELVQVDVNQREWQGIFVTELRF